MFDRAVLITGITGFLGGALGALLAARGDRLIAVVRAGDARAARARIAGSLSRFLARERAVRAAGTAMVILGDVATDSTFESPAFDAATHVVHAAGCTSFASRQEVWRSNVLGTTLLARRMRRAPRLARFLHVGTAYCCGERPNRVVFEDDSPREGHGHVNEYARSKAEAELRLLAMRDDIRLVVARPSVVIGHTTLGIGPSPSLYWYYRALAALGAGPSPLAARRDVVPVDYVADALAFLLSLECPRFTTYHVSAGDAAAVTLEQILACFGAPPAWRTSTPGELAEMGDAIPGLGRTEDQRRKVARGVSACANFGALRVEYFDNQRLRTEGFRGAPRFTEYLPLCIETAGSATIYEQMVDES
jgi:nucleoside-diphosphate-sugar epimerase